jgi:hypothetical protein
MAELKTGENSRSRIEESLDRGDPGQAAHDVATVARRSTGRLTDEMREAATDLLGEQKDRAADVVHGIAAALRRTAGNLEGENAAAARYADRAAARVDRFSETLRARQWGDLLADVEDFARRQPAFFLLGAVGAGLMVGRLAAASADRRYGDIEPGVSRSSFGEPSHVPETERVPGFSRQHEDMRQSRPGTLPQEGIGSLGGATTEQTAGTVL